MGKIRSENQKSAARINQIYVDCTLQISQGNLSAIAVSPSYANTAKYFSAVSCGEKGRGRWRMWSKLPEASGSMVRHEPWLKIPELFLAALLPCAPTPRKNDSWSDPRSRGTRRKKKKKKKKKKKTRKVKRNENCTPGCTSVKIFGQ